MELSGMREIRVIVSGGGTAGHIYPAVATVETMINRFGSERVKVLFVGAEGKMEMTKIPKLGYDIVGLPIIGLQRSLSLKNLSIPFKILKSLNRASKILKDFKPDIVIGFGGYASLPLLWQAQNMGLKTIIWEGNSYAGMANKILGRRVCNICVSYDNMSRFFNINKIIKTGNPIRGIFGSLNKKSDESLTYFGFDNNKPIVLFTGGSLGARVINDSVLNCLDRLMNEDKVYVIWQIGSYYYDKIDEVIKTKEYKNLWYSDFIYRMDLAYSAADLVVARSGASTVTELSLSKMPALLVPSSNVAEDHQKKNAMSLVDADAAVMLTDEHAVDDMYDTVMGLIFDRDKLMYMSEKIAEFSTKDAADNMVDVIIKNINV